MARSSGSGRRPAGGRGARQHREVPLPGAGVSSGPSLASAVVPRVWQGVVYRPLDERCIVVEGRLRWSDDEQVMRDDPVTWALEFEDDLLVRFVPARSQLEAETILSTERGDVDPTGVRG